MNELIENKNLVVERTPSLIAKEINHIRSQTQKILLYNSIEIGRRLVEAKALLNHGEWGEWLEKSVDYSQRTANNLMKIFEEYGADQISLLDTNLNSQAFANLTYTQAIALLKVPSEERENFVEENPIEDMSTRELEKAIKEREEALNKLKEAETLAEKRAKEAAEQKEQYEKALEKQKKLEAENKKQLEKANKLKTELKEIKNQIHEADNAGNSEEVEKLKENLQKLTIELNQANAKAEELEKELKEKPIEINAEIPQEVEIELQELKQFKESAIKEKAVNKQTAKFAVYFDELINNFKNLLGTLQEIEDPEEKEKYKNAIVGMIGKMNQSL